MTAFVTVTLRPGILDPQGLAIADGLAGLGHSGVKSVRVGKVFEIALDDSDDVHERVTQMAQDLLANPVIEDFTVEVR
ncbi:MAG: phosphoribosylformylglycinamidine synthase [Myxococcota bacterium]|jgi:phosphoribosylformylglycinamidine synthase